MKRSAFGLVLVLSAVSPSLVWAQAQTQDMKDADTLYNDGVAAMKDGRFADACPKLERSNKLEPGVGVMLWLANCYEKIGKTASAFNQYIAAEQLAAQTKDDRAKVAHKYAAGLEAKLSKLVIALPTGGHVDGLEVRRDGDLVKSFGDSVTVDPGTHLIEASAPGYKHWESKVDVGTDGATASVNVGPLEKEETKVQEKIVERRVEVSSWTPLKITGLVIAGVGVVGLGVGGAFGVLAKGSLDDSNNVHCDATNHCDPQGLALRSDAQSSALLSTISFIGGGVLVAGGLLMFFLAPKPTAETAPAAAIKLVPALSPSFSGMAAVGSF